MKKKNKVLLVVVLFLVVLFGVGQFFAFSNPPSSDQTGNQNPTSTTQGPPTAIIKYIPQSATSTPVVNGSCWTNSIAAPYRNDAWRCFVGNSISDPCFQIPNSKELICGMNPSSKNSTSSFILRLTQALPTPQAFQGSIPSNWAWIVQLLDGTLCSPFTGTRPFTADGQSANYGCAPGPLGTDLYIFGDLDASSSAWTAIVGTLSTPTSGLPIVQTSKQIPVATVWQ